MARVTDIHVVDTAVLPAPEYLCRELPRSEEQAAFVAGAREQLHRIIFGDDRRFLVVVGPCSLHDEKAGLEYADQLAKLAAELSDRLLLVMRVYFEKPRTTVGWKGLIMDPQLDGSNDIPNGLKAARRILRAVIDRGLPTATELLDPITPQYIADLICWSAVGARTSESQTHRQMASGLSMPLGFKNATSGAIPPALNAIRAASKPQTFLGISYQGLASAVTTGGNPNCHLILRGGDHGPNFSREDISAATQQLVDAGLRPAVMIDCSHDNSSKDPERQPEVLHATVDHLLAGEEAVIGAMLESNLVAGKQPFPQPKKDLVYGQSITDGCIDFPTTEKLLRDIHARLAPRFPT